MFGTGSHAAEKAVAVTPNNDAVLIDGLRALYVGGAGNVSVVTWRDDTVTFVNVPEGAIIPIRVKRVRATDTTATNILALG